MSTTFASLGIAPFDGDDTDQPVARIGICSFRDR